MALRGTGGFTVLHGPGTEHFTPVPDGFTVAGDCSCGFAFTARGGTVREARQAMARKARDHRGQVAAAGPGWRQA